MQSLQPENKFCSSFDKRLLNVLQLGVACFTIFTAFISCSSIQETVLQSVHNRTGLVDAKAGYYSLAVFYGAWIVFSFFSVAIVELITAKWSMVIGACFYVLFMASFLYIRTAFLYSAAVLEGVGAALLWTGYGKYLSKNSDNKTMGRNTAIIVAMIQSSNSVGGIFLYIRFQNSVSLNDTNIKTIYGTFTCVAGIGVIILAFLRQSPAQGSSATYGTLAEESITTNINSENPPTGTRMVTKIGDEGESEKLLKHDSNQHFGFWQNFGSTFKLLISWPMNIFFLVFIFCGLNQTFFSGVYPTCLAFTSAFGEASKLILAENNIVFGVGQISAGITIGILSRRIRNRHSSVFLIAISFDLITYILIFINIPTKAPLEPTLDQSYIYTNYHLALFCGFLLGFADGSICIQIYSLLGTYYEKNCASAFALFYLFTGAAACGGFFYSAHLTLEWQLLILTLTSILGGLIYFRVNKFTQQRISR